MRRAEGDRLDEGREAVRVIPEPELSRNVQRAARARLIQATTVNSSASASS